MDIQTQCAAAVMMIRPAAFDYNSQTAAKHKSGCRCRWSRLHALSIDIRCAGGGHMESSANRRIIAGSARTSGQTFEMEQF